MEDRIFAICKVCGNVVYREPGKRHGDGQEDTDEHPVWLTWSYIDEYEGDVNALDTVYCGCND